MSKGLYIHIPFCKSICTYCDFPKAISKESMHQKYIEELINEINYYENKLNNITSIYFGGGTPNSIKLELLEALFKRLETLLRKSIENTIELNPELVTEDLCILLKKYNINRASLGVQTINDESIKLLNRHHNREIVVQAINMLKKHNINNINVDFIFGIPNTNINDVKNDLDFILSLPITHVSYYSLILEEKTVLMHLVNNKRLELLDEDICADMYELIRSTLANNRYKHYEISNYAKNGYESKHNLLYWSSKEYIGCGCGAAGYIDNIRYENNKSLSKYFINWINDKIEIDEFERKREFFLLGLRKIDGVKISDYKKLFNANPLDDFDFNNLLLKDLIIIDNDVIKIPYDKILLANLVYEEFVGE